MPAPGDRVVVRRLLPSGQASDVLGTLVSDGDPLIVRADRDGAEHAIPRAEIVRAKSVPPRPVRASEIRSLDLARARSWWSVEREWIDELIGPRTLVDVLRRHVGEVDGPYSWWSWMGQAFDKNVGWRIDYHLASPKLAKTATAAWVLARYARNPSTPDPQEVRRCPEWWTTPPASRRSCAPPGPSPATPASSTCPRRKAPGPTRS